ncbi:MAG: AAA family ATPase [Acidimicrobiales bacterium]
MTEPNPPGVLRDLRTRLHAEVEKVVVGQADAVDALLVSLAVGGHVLLEGVPGVAKTLLASTFARALGLEFRRAQFTPDLLPSDLTGTMTLRDRELVFRPGPVFANVLLADEINRTPPKTQAALLEAMQEGQVTVDGTAHALPQPFLVVATQNPIEYEGTYPLPEAQLDRFLVKVLVDYPSEADERALLGLGRRGLVPTGSADVQPVVGAHDVAVARRGRRHGRHRGGGGLRHRARAPDPCPAERGGGGEPPGRGPPPRGRQGVGPAVGAPLRDPRRRDPGGPVGAAPPAGAAPRGRARPPQPRRRGGQRHRRHPRAPLSRPAPWSACPARPGEPWPSWA